MTHWQAQGIGCGQCQQRRTHEAEVCDQRGTHPTSCPKPVEPCETTPKRSLDTSKLAAFLFPCFAKRDVCTNDACRRQFPPRECPKDCLQPVQRCALKHHMLEVGALVATFVVFVLGVLGVYGHGAPEPSFVASLDVVTRPTSGMWGAHVFFFLWLGAGAAIVNRTAFRSDQVRIVLERQFYLLVALVAWAISALFWFYADSRLDVWLCFAFLAVSAIAFHLEYDRVYLRGNQVPPMRVYAFFIAGIAFAAAWSLVLSIYVLNVALAAEGVSDVSAVLLLTVGYAVGLAASLWAFSFVYTGVLSVSLAMIYAARMNADAFGIATIVLFALSVYFTFIFFWTRVVSTECRHGLELFVLSEPAQDKNLPQ